eukprot:TRINITY_DN1440_c0_g2_i9.p1 TRINITY_DN1440_c0_g2~~TRINITY_DN1440_c0_g2_i9.p1  ORF type:complete len:1034 (-),score=302.89 TRINITY_DN1440_c0_g2_i9:4-3060(-)
MCIRDRFQEDESDQEDDEEEEEEEEEENNEDEEEEEEDQSSKRRSVRVKGKKSAAETKKSQETAESSKNTTSAKGKGRKPAKAKEKEESEEEEDEEESEQNTKASKNLKKQKVSEKKAKNTKKEVIDEESEVSEEEVKPKKAAAKKGKAKGKKKKDDEDDFDEEKPSKFKKGVFNPAVTIVDHYEFLESPSNDFIQDASVKNSNKNLIRAAYTKNHKLLEKILSSSLKISTLFETWGPESDEDALYYIFKNNDKKALGIFLDALSNEKFKYTTQPNSGIQTINTGNNSIYTFGVRVRKVNVGRGGREGNNAFTADISSYYDVYSMMDNSLNKIVELDCFDPEMLKLLRAKYDQADNLLESKIARAVRVGNYVLAGHLVAYANSRGGYGFNFLHEQALTKKKFTDFKKVSVTKKAVGNNAINPIHCAAVNPHVDLLKKLLDASQEYSTMDENMRKPIHYAVACESTATLEYLLTKGVDPREGDFFKNTPLMIACQSGRAHNAKILLEGDNPVDVNAKSKEGMAAIHFAALTGSTACIEVLLEHGANIDLPGKMRMTPLIIAASKGHLDCVKLLLEKKAKINAKDKLKRNALVLACRNGHLKVASVLLRRGIPFNEPDSSKNFPIHYAAGYGFQECIDILIQAGADPNVLNSWNLTALNVAMLKNQFGCVKQLLNYPETDVNCKDNNGRTLISLSVDNLTEASMSHIEFLVKDKKADVNIPDLQGLSPLHYVAKLNKDQVSTTIANWHKLTEEEREKEAEKYIKLVMQLAEILIENGANINQQSLNKSTPFMLALENSNYDFISLILKQKGLDLLQKTEDNRGIYHFLGNLVTQEEGIKVFYTILELVGNQHNLLNLVNDDGLAPLHIYINNFSSQAQQVYQTFYNKIKETETKKKQKQNEKDNKQDTSTKQPQAAAFTPQLFNPMMAKRKIPAKARRAFYPNQQFSQQQATGVFFTKEEEEDMENRAQEQFGNYLNQFQKLLQDIIKEGADPHIAVDKLAKFRDPQKMEIEQNLSLIHI